ncbi:MAG: alpha/beta hydrolase, partial [Lapillicoccus sp.]
DRVAHPAVDELSVEEIRAIRSFAAPTRPPFTWVTGAVPTGVTISAAGFEARDGYEVPLRVYRPSTRGPWPVVVYFHGGGLVIGNPRGYDPLCGYLADSVEALVVSVDYRLAPEFVAPQGVRDCVDAVRWVGSGAGSLGGDPERIAVCGDSAGGNLAAVVSQVVRDEGGPRIAHQALLYPGVDATMSYPSIAELAEAPMLTRREIVAYLHRYLDGSGLDPKDPLVSPLWADDLSGLPPALVQTADLDPLRDEAEAYAARLADAGVSVRATNYLRAPHGFMSIPGVTPCAAQARLELTTELRRHLA